MSKILKIEATEFGHEFMYGEGSAICIFNWIKIEDLQFAIGRFYACYQNEKPAGKLKLSIASSPILKVIDFYSDSDIEKAAKIIKIDSIEKVKEIKRTLEENLINAQKYYEELLEDY